MKIISCLALIVASAERDCREGADQCSLWMPTQKAYCISVPPEETSLSCSSLPLFSSSLPHWYVYLVFLSCALWLPPARSPHFSLSPVPAVVTKSRSKTGCNWLCLRVAFHSSCRAYQHGYVLPPLGALQLGLYSTVSGQNALHHLLYLKPILIQVTAPHIPAYFTQGNALFK